MAFDGEHTERTVTRDRVMRLRDFLKTLPDERFDIHDYISTGHYEAKVKDRINCGTACCILGWAAALFQPDLPIPDAEEIMPEVLGIGEQAGALFYPAGFTAPDNGYTRQRAVGVLDHYLATGEIDWAVAP